MVAAQQQPNTSRPTRLRTSQHSARPLRPTRHLGPLLLLPGIRSRHHYNRHVPRSNINSHPDTIRAAPMGVNWAKPRWTACQRQRASSDPSSSLPWVRCSGWPPAWRLLSISGYRFDTQTLPPEVAGSGRAPESGNRIERRNAPVDSAQASSASKRLRCGSSAQSAGRALPAPARRPRQRLTGRGACVGGSDDDSGSRNFCRRSETQHHSAIDSRQADPAPVATGV